VQGSLYKDGQVEISLNGENAEFAVSNSKEFLKDISNQGSYYSSALKK